MQRLGLLARRVQARASRARQVQRRIEFERQGAWDWEVAYADDARALWRVLHEKARGEPCADSFRVARLGAKGSKRAMRHFVKARSCCGSHEEVVTIGLPLIGRRYPIGFNYGH